MLNHYHLRFFEGFNRQERCYFQAYAFYLVVWKIPFLSLCVGKEKAIFTHLHPHHAYVDKQCRKQHTFHVGIEKYLYILHSTIVQENPIQ